jgi:hypothetical protein
MLVTSHAQKAIKKRLGLPKRAVINGLRHKDVSGRLRKYFYYLWCHNRTATNIIVHNGFVFIGVDQTLVTMHPLPNNLRKCAKQQQDKYNKGD